MDEHCDLSGGQIFQNFHCLLNQVDKKSDKFYLIQLLTDANGGYFVFTRWGKNGTTGQSKLEGPTKQSNAEKSFHKKFHDKTKNKWENRANFVPAKGKYTLVIEATKSATKDDSQEAANVEKSVTLETEKPSFPDTDMSGISLPVDILYQIMTYLRTKDVLKCMSVCKLWHMFLSERYLWKMLISNQFDLTLMTDIKEEGPFGMWSDPEVEEWYCYYDNEDDAYVMRPFPSIWKCGVIHPFGLDPMAEDVKSLQGFCRSLEILTHMRSKTKKYYIASGNECSSSEGGDEICVVLFPWDKDELPSGKTILRDIFHVHPEIYDVYSKWSDQDETRTERLSYHLPKDEDDEKYDERSEHDQDVEPCLNRIFGFSDMCFRIVGNTITIDEVNEFYEWLQNIMVPSKSVLAGDGKLNPVIVFFITTLAPKWVGGVLTAVTHT